MRAARRFLNGVLGFGLAAVGSAAELPSVTVTELSDRYVLANGVVVATVAKASGDLVSLRYREMEMLGTLLDEQGQPDLERDPPGANPNGLNPGMTDHQYAFWSHDAMGPRGTAPAQARLTIDPRTNGGERAEVSIKGLARGRKMGTGPGARADGQFAADVEIRYALGRGLSGVYTYCIFEHPAEYPATSLGEARFCAKLADHFDWMSIAPELNFSYPKDLREGDKYIYTAVQSENPAFGWSSTSRKVGFWVINPSMEYISGGPTKVEFLGHRDTNRVAAPCVLNYWRSSHYGGARVDVAAGEAWTKVVGPFLLYVNAAATPQAAYDDACARQGVEQEAWPYAWVAGVDYPGRDERSTVTGRLRLEDPYQNAGDKQGFRRLRVGLTAPAYVAPIETTPDGPPAPVIGWQRDAKYYQFWADANEDGRFELPHVRPGRYTLHALAEGVLGEYQRADIKVEPGRELNLGELGWTPVRRGRPLWEIGIADRSAKEFAGGDRFRDPWISLKYAEEFPRDVTFVIGRSDPRRDWFFQHVPHNEDPAAQPQPYRGVPTPGRATPYTIVFEGPEHIAGVATLRLAICGTGARELAVEVNGEPAGRLENLPGDGVIARHGSHGIWYEREVPFPAALLRRGLNQLTLTVPAGPINDGLMYDYLRLELDDRASAPPSAP